MRNKAPVHHCPFFGGSLAGQVKELMGFWDGNPPPFFRGQKKGEIYRRRAVARGHGIGWIYELRGDA